MSLNDFLTPWFPTYTRPVRKGYYMVVCKMNVDSPANDGSGFFGARMAFWDGVGWTHSPSSSDYFFLGHQWRGLKEPTSC